MLYVVVKYFWPLAREQSALVATETIAISELTSVQWLIVPRHPQRFDEIEQLLAGAGLTVSRRSQWADGPEPADVWLGDSMGEMQLYYGLADVAMLGGSFAPLGGQNLIEAAACGCPVVMGPHTFNFAQAADSSADAGAALRVADMAEGVEQAVRIARTPDLQAHMQLSALQFAQRHRGAANASAQMIAALLESTEGFVNTGFEASIFDEDAWRS